MATVALTLFLLASCSGAVGGGASGSPLLPSGSRVLPSPTTEAPTGSPIDLTSLTGRIVFDNFQDVSSINADGTGLRRLTRSPWPEFQPTLSPDRRFIAYRSEPHEYPQLWVMNADGSGQHRLTPTAASRTGLPTAR